jgi:uncharacterized beta-barrel protein YwiB (DUF1934 family)
MRKGDVKMRGELTREERSLAELYVPACEGTVMAKCIDANSSKTFVDARAPVLL